MRKEEHLTREAEYVAVYQKARSWVNNLLVVRALPNGLGVSRYGFSVSKRVGKATVRNHIKRQLRVIVRSEQTKPGWDIILIARPGIARANYPRIRQSVGRLLSGASLLRDEATGTEND